MVKKIMIIVFITMAFVSVSFSTVFAIDATDLRYITEIYPPFNFEKNGKLKGIAVDFLKEIWADMGVDERRSDDVEEDADDKARDHADHDLGGKR